MDVRAAVAHEAGEPLVIETVRLEGPESWVTMASLELTVFMNSQMTR